MNETINECIQKLDQKEYDCLKRIVINKWLCNSLDDCLTYERKKLEAECCSFYEYYDCVIKEFKTVEECDSEAMPRKDRLKKQLDSKEYNCNQYPKGWKHCRQSRFGLTKRFKFGSFYQTEYSLGRIRGFYSSYYYIYIQIKTFF
jgi:hypothetical protein